MVLFLIGLPPALIEEYKGVAAQQKARILWTVQFLKCSLQLLVSNLYEIFEITYVMDTATKTMNFIPIIPHVSREFATLLSEAKVNNLKYFSTKMWHG